MRRFPLLFVVLFVTVFTSSRCYESYDSSLTNFDGAFANWQNQFFGPVRDTSSFYAWPGPHDVDHDVPSFRDHEQAETQYEFEDALAGVPDRAPYDVGYGPTTEDFNKEREPLASEVEYVSGPLGNPSHDPAYFGRQPQDFVPQRPEDSSSLFQHHFGTFFNSPGAGLFPGFPEFGFFDFPSAKPWWKGENVCTNREEADEEETGEEKKTNSDMHHMSSFNLNFESCSEKSSKYVCTSIAYVNGRKKTVKITRQCCHGFARPRNSEPNKHCEKVDIHPLTETAEKLGASEFIRSAKNNGLEEKFSQNVTVFAPTDIAFTDFAENMLEKNLVVLPFRKKRALDVAGITTKDLIMAHTIQGIHHIEDIDNEELLPTEFENASIRINIFPRSPDDHNAQYPFRYTANCAPIIKVNKIAVNGMVHVVDRVLTPAVNNIMEIIRHREDMTVLRTILEKTGLDKMLDQDGNDKHFTIFAPTDSAFQKLNPELRRKLKAGSGCATNILKNHILDITFCSVAALNGAKTTTYNLLNEKMVFEFGSRKAESSSEVEDMKAGNQIMINGMSTILETDVMGSNGALHVIDTVLPTDTGMPVSTTLEKNNLTIFKQLIEAGDLQDEIDSLQNVTYFVPSDKAFESSESGRAWIDLMNDNPEQLKGNEDLKKFLQYHIGEPLVKTCDLTENMLMTKNGDDLRVNLYTTHPVFVKVMNLATVNCARLLHFDDESCGSVVHEVDKVLEPPKYTILQMLEANKDYSMFLKFIKESNLTHLLDNLEENLTVFVPKDDVFREVQDWYNEMLENRDELESMIKAHIVPDVICCAGIVQSDWPFVRTTETINNLRLKLNRHRRPQVQNAGISKCDIVAKNGVVHEINDVISVQQPTRPQTDVNRNIFQHRPLQFWF